MGWVTKKPDEIARQGWDDHCADPDCRYSLYYIGFDPETESWLYKCLACGTLYQEFTGDRPTPAASGWMALRADCSSLPPCPECGGAIMKLCWDKETQSIFRQCWDCGLIFQEYLKVSPA